MKRTNLILVLLLFCLIPGQITANTEEKKVLDIVFIGNSITYGAGLSDPKHDAPPVKAAIYLEKQPGIASVKFANMGVSGCTTVDYLPEMGTLFSGMQEVADKFKDDKGSTIIFSIMLGTNDSAVKGTNGCPVSPGQYQVNMRKIIDRLLVLYPSCIVVVNRPVWYSPNTYNGAMYLQEGLERLQAYYPELRKLVSYYSEINPGRVYLGDTLGFDYFKKHAEEELQREQGNAGIFLLHPNQKGALSLGELWGKAIYNIMFE
ncbi:GDSL-type esterase/lipase family protein [Parabacteroides provencensis]|uniref:GDSL-type esterase/lipase family protein n=1 Tax=Parabacteroides provencensis TaxID=1944636 RepID=UPI001E343399|nr:GDSL-type esterase/lipase family protein [Parabacteroides provencensis]